MCVFSICFSFKGSVKDRAALFLIREGIRLKKIAHLEQKDAPVPIIVEGTAGNTGIGLVHLCNALGFECHLFMPNNQSQEKIEYLSALGARIKQFPVAPFNDPMNYNNQAKAFSAQTPNSHWTNQFDNQQNRQAHIETTGPEIWRQTRGKVDAVVFGVGTGGTLSGCGIYLKEKNKGIKVFAADPPGSVLYNWYKHGKLERTDGASITEGIGQGRVTENLKGAPIDDALFISDHESVEMTYRLLHEEGFFVGATSGLNVVAAVKVAKEIGPGKTIVTCLCDTGAKYMNRLFSKTELDKRGLLNSVPEKYKKFLKP
jgi:cysteine synthase